MTPTELQKLEAALEKRDYRKWTNCLIGKEDYAWFKSFGEHLDKYGDRDNDYQIAFRIYDWIKNYPQYARPEESSIGVTVTMIPSNLDNRVDCDYSLQLAVPDIDLCERMFKDMFEVIKKYGI